MTSPAERYVRARQRAAEAARLPALADFAAELPFAMDPFQRAACEALEGGSGVLVCAPTGAGKTVVGEFAVHLALRQGRKCFYTTPIKALSNQKYADLVRRYGSDQVGLLTGDNTVNGEAPVVVMTTEVLRNMLYAGSQTLAGLGYVVMDEVHYLADRARGAVWEEVIIHLPESVSVVSLSATVSNAEEFGEWLTTLRGTTRVVIEEHRPVPLEQLYMVGLDLHPMHIRENDHVIPNPYVVSLGQREVRHRTYRRRSDGRRQLQHRAGEEAEDEARCGADHQRHDHPRQLAHLPRVLLDGRRPLEVGLVHDRTEVGRAEQRAREEHAQEDEAVAVDRAERQVPLGDEAAGEGDAHDAERGERERAHGPRHAPGKAGQLADLGLVRGHVNRAGAQEERDFR